MRGPRRPIESSVATFLLGCLAFSPPILLIFGAEVSFLTLPLLYIYLFAAWALIILLIAWIADLGPGDLRPEDDGGGGNRTGAP